MDPIESAKSAYLLALRWLAGRDLSSAEIATRLRRRGCADNLIAEALERLRAAGAVNDERVAVSRARSEAASRGRGRERVLLRLRSMGITPEIARHAVDVVFQDVDETALLQRAIDRRLKTSGGVIRTPAEYRRVYAALLRQGFAPAKVRAALDRRRGTSTDFTVDDE